MIGPLAKIIRTSNLFKKCSKIVLKVWFKSNLCILSFDWLIDIHLFTPLPNNASFIIAKQMFVREELSDVVLFFEHNLKKSLCKICFGEFTLAPLKFDPCTSRTDSFYFTYHFPFVSVTIRNPLKFSSNYVVDNLKRYQRHIKILDNSLWRRCSYFILPYMLESSGYLLWCRETEANIPLHLVSQLPI